MGWGNSWANLRFWSNGNVVLTSIPKSSWPAPHFDRGGRPPFTRTRDVRRNRCTCCASLIVHGTVLGMSTPSGACGMPIVLVNIGLAYAYVRPISLLTLHPTHIAWLKLSGKSPMGLGIPPIKIKHYAWANRPSQYRTGTRLRIAPAIAVRCALRLLL